MAETMWQHLRWNLVILDKQDHPVLAVSVTAMRSAIPMAMEWISRLESETRSTGPPIPFLMFVDLDTILTFSFINNNEFAKVEFQVPSETVLSVYDSDFGKKRVFEQYLSTLVEIWLQDFVSNANSANPVLLKEFTEIGLAERLKGGTIHREVSFADLDSVRRDQLRHESLPGARLFD